MIQKNNFEEHSFNLNFILILIISCFYFMSFKFIQVKLIQHYLNFFKILDNHNNFELVFKLFIRFRLYYSFKL